MIGIMFFVLNRKFVMAVALVCVLAIAGGVVFHFFPSPNATPAAAEGDYIKWVDFGVSYAAMERALDMDIKSYNEPVKLNWVELLAYLGGRYGGDFKRYKNADMDALAKKLKNGEKIEDLAANLKYYNYYKNAYGAVLNGMVGLFEVEAPDPNNAEQTIMIRKYGLKAYSPIARGYGFSHCDDFGNSRSYGFKRKHLGNDLMGNVGTPIIAVESGTVEALGWNQYGGWRIGIRSMDGMRYYYYAHLRKDHPYVKSLKEGDVVKAGDVIGYLGMTGYSTKENVNNINTPHLHFGIQLIFDESQKEGVNEIWVDAYNIVKLLNRNKAVVVKDGENKEFKRLYKIEDPVIYE